MSKPMTWAAISATLLLCGGCANMTSIWRNEHGAGNVMAMDAQQRVVLSSSRSVPQVFDLTTTTRTTTDTGTSTVAVTTQELRNVPKVYYCPEPSPDAIASFASALGIGAAKSTGTESVDARINSAVQTAVAAVGLRTPTTQVIRDLITAACIADLNGSFESPAFKDAFARNQQFVLAAHAIAVIGGEPVAAQPGVGGSAGTAGLDPAITYNNLKAAQASRQKAETDEVAAAAALETAEADLKAAEGKLEEDEGQDDDALKKAVAEAKDARDKKKAVHDAAKTRVKDTKDMEAFAAKAATAAAAYTSAAASGTVIPGTATVPNRNISDNAVAVIGNITEQVLSQAFTLDKCITHLREIASLTRTVPASDIASLRTNVMDLCNLQVREQVELTNRRLLQRKAQ